LNCIVAAEQDIESLWTAPSVITINENFVGSAEGLNTGFLASNSFFVVNVSYAQLEGALASHQYSVYAKQAVASLPASDPNSTVNGGNFSLPEAYAQMLGLTSSNSAQSVTLNTSYGWNYGQDVINALVHEISEGAMGRIGGLGDQNGFWSTMDLFRFNASGAHDYTDGRDGQTTYFSYNNGATLSSSANLSFNNEYNGSGAHVNGGDTADFTQLDVFGTGSPGEGNQLSQTDIEMMDALGWMPNSSGFLNSPFQGNPGWTVVGVGDFTANGLSDLVYYNASLGVTEIELLNGNTIAGGGVITNNPFERDPAWTVVGVGDFNANGFSDLVYYNATLGVAEIDFLNGNTSVGGGVITNSPFEGSPSWTVVGVGDFNGDGKSDLVYYNATPGVTEIEFLNGNTGVGGGVITNSPFEGSPGWTVVGVGDFNDNGKSDLVYYNAALGVTEIEFLNGTANAGGGVITNNPFEGSPGWTVVGVGDFNGDGKNELVYYNAALGVTEIEFLNGTANAGGGVIANDPYEGNPDWTVVGVGDFNGNGMSDLVYYDAKTGMTELLFLSGNVAVGSASAASPESSNASVATIGVGATLELGANQSQSVSFSGSTGKLILDDPTTFNGEILNFTGDGTLTGSDQIDLKNINFSSVQDSFSNGVLTVTDGVDSVVLNFIGSYTLQNFKFASDGEGGTLVYDPPVGGSLPAPERAETDTPPNSRMSEMLLDLMKHDPTAPADHDGGHAHSAGFDAATHHHHSGFFI